VRIIVEDDEGGGERVTRTIPGKIPRWFGRAIEALARADTLLRAAPVEVEHGAQIELNVKGANVTTKVTQFV
jgi:hypothetical protein